MSTRQRRGGAPDPAHPAGASDPPQGIGAQELAAWRALLKAHAAVIERIERELTAAGQIPLGDYDVLFALYEAPGHRLRMRDLSRAIVLHKSTLSRRVDHLALGLLKRERPGSDWSDLRSAHAVLTNEGIAALRGAWPVYARGIQEHFARHLSDEEIAALRSALTRVFEAAQAGAPASQTTDRQS